MSRGHVDCTRGGQISVIEIWCIHAKDPFRGVAYALSEDFDRMVGTWSDAQLNLHILNANFHTILDGRLVSGGNRKAFNPKILSLVFRRRGHWHGLPFLTLCGSASIWLRRIHECLSELIKYSPTRRRMLAENP